MNYIFQCFPGLEHDSTHKTAHSPPAGGKYRSEGCKDIFN